jgi:chemotaxis family two-component system response regulator Rcp1
MTLSCLKPAEILFIEDNPADVRLTMEVLKDVKLCDNISTVNDGVQALDFPYRRGEYGSAGRPDIMKLPGM